MKLVFSSSDSAQVALAQSRLDAAGISCEVRNNAVSQAIPTMAFAAELWVLQDEAFEDARRLISPEGDTTAQG
jgi:hypothetical protein